MLLPAVVSVAALGVMAARSPTLLAFPVMMLVSLTVTALSGRGRRRGAAMDAERVDYLEYLSGLRDQIAEVAAKQRHSLNHAHPDPDTLWTLIGGPRMWERQPGEPEFCRVRVGLGDQPLATRLVAAPPPPAQRRDPVTVSAQRRFLRTHSTIAAVPVVIPLRDNETITIDGEPNLVRGLLRAVICQLAVWHPPGRLAIIGVVGDQSRAYWDWLKWLPHNQHPSLMDLAGPARMLYSTTAEAQAAVAALGLTRAVVIADGEQFDNAATVLRVGALGSAPVVRYSGGQDMLSCPDYLGLDDAVACARRLAGYAGDVSRRGGSDWASLAGIDEVTDFAPVTLWRNQDRRERLCVPIGTAPDGQPVYLDIKEAAQQGMGPHGLCIGATGSGKSELLRTVALGMMARNSPEVLNLLLVDFKGGATFLELAHAPHVAAVITNLADEVPLVTRMRDALAGEMNRRQQILRAAGNFVSIAAYEAGRGRGSAALPTLFIIVDEFSELLSQHPDFADVFVAIGRLGRSLGMHLLLASQRLDEGRLRGLEAHLSYRICLKTLSASESRTVLGTLDAYELPNAPGAGYLRVSSDAPIRFQSAFVSGPVAANRVSGSVSVVRFTAEASGAVTDSGGELGPSVLRTVLGRLAGQGPPAHRVWLPPLGEAPALGVLLGDATWMAVPIGIVDQPYEQARRPLMVDLSGAAGNVAVVGAPRSGKTSTLCTMITALAATHDPGQVQFYCLDFGGGALGAMRILPHVGAVADRGQPELVYRIVAELASLVHSREASGCADGVRDSNAEVFLVVDGWADLCGAFEALEHRVAAIARQGLSFGVHVALSASRWAEIRPALKDQIGTRVELRLGDPADSEVDRRQARQVPHDRPGRGLSSDGLHMIVARSDGTEVRPGHSVAPPIPLLPTEVSYETLIAGSEFGPGVLLGLEERRLRPVSLDFERHRHLLVLGGSGCGKTATLRTLCREIVRTNTAAQAQLFIVDFRRSLLGVVETDHVDRYAMSPAALDLHLPGLTDLLRRRMPGPDVTQAQLRDRSWWTGPDVYLIVDDYDLVAGSRSGPLPALLEYLPYAKDLGLHLIVARRSGGAARALFEPLLAVLRDLGCMGLMMSGRPDEGVLLGSRPPGPLPPGRGILTGSPDVEQLVQVAWSPTG